jgi:hypothetical protein
MQPPRAGEPGDSGADNRDPSGARQLPMGSCSGQSRM